MKFWMPKKEDIINSQWLGWYKHFNERLTQRYSMSLSFEEYKECCKRKVQLLKRITQNKAFGIIEINGKEVLVVKETHRDRILSTALPYSYIGRFKHNP